MKRALLIGINYVGKSYELSGCENDVNEMKKFVSMLGYNEIKIITEKTLYPSRRNIITALDWLLESKTTFFYYSGHGGQIKANDRNEIDGFDECIYPSDYENEGVITDNELRNKIDNNGTVDSLMHFVFDCCHSASILDQKWNYYINHGNPELLINGDYSITNAKTICISGSKDEQKSLSIKDGNKSRGILTDFLINSYNSNITYAKLMVAIDKKICEKYSLSQSPCISFGRDIMLNDIIRF